MARTLADAQRDDGRADEPGRGPEGRGADGGLGPWNLADADGREPSDGNLQRGGQHGQQPEDGGASRPVGYADRAGRAPRDSITVGTGERPEQLAGSGPWDSLVWLPCRDGKARPTQRALQRLVARLPAELGYRSIEDSEEAYLSPLVHGATNRVGRLRGYGNAINPYVAAAFIEAYLRTRQ